MAKVHPGATLTPHFREFLPPWVARQPWYRGTGTPSLSPVGYFRFEDPAGEVGIETDLVTDGSALYQIPMTYRGAHGDTVGYYIPARRKRIDADRAALKEAAARLQEMLASEGISEREVLKDFKKWRSGRRK